MSADLPSRLLRRSSGKKEDAPAPITQGRMDFRKRLPVWIQEMPQFGKFRTRRARSELQASEERGSGERPERRPRDHSKRNLSTIMDFMDYELLRLFRQRDYTAKYNQNRYRRQQIYFLILAVAATLVGSLQVVGPQHERRNDAAVRLYGNFVALLDGLSGGAGWARIAAGIVADQPPSCRTDAPRILPLPHPHAPLRRSHRVSSPDAVFERAADINRGMYPQEITGRGRRRNGTFNAQREHMRRYISVFQRFSLEDQRDYWSAHGSL